MALLVLRMNGFHLLDLQFLCLKAMKDGIWVRMCSCPTYQGETLTAAAFLGAEICKSIYQYTECGRDRAGVKPPEKMSK